MSILLYIHVEEKLALRLRSSKAWISSEDGKRQMMKILFRKNEDVFSVRGDGVMIIGRKEDLCNLMQCVCKSSWTQLHIYLEIRTATLWCRINRLPDTNWFIYIYIHVYTHIYIYMYLRCRSLLDMHPSSFFGRQLKDLMSLHAQIYIYTYCILIIYMYIYSIIIDHQVWMCWRGQPVIVAFGYLYIYIQYIHI